MNIAIILTALALFVMVLCYRDTIQRLRAQNKVLVNDNNRLRDEALRNLIVNDALRQRCSQMQRICTSADALQKVLKSFEHSGIGGAK